MRELATGSAVALVIGLGAAGASAQTAAPACSFDQTLPQVSVAARSITNAASLQPGEARSRLLDQATQNLEAALAAGGSEDPATWYYLGLKYALDEDLSGADSTFNRVVTLEPACSGDVNQYRESLWAPHARQGLTHLRNGEYDGAKTSFRLANSIYRGRNLGFYYMALIFADEGATDSALTYFKEVAAIGAGDTLGLNNYAAAVSSVASTYQATNRVDSAVAWFNRLREVAPGDGNALLALAQIHEARGSRQQAYAYYDSLVVQGVDAHPDSLFKVGAKMFVTGRLDVASRAFERGLVHNPYQRNALFNLASINMTLAGDNGTAQADRDRAVAQLGELAQRLVAIDPNNRGSAELLVMAYEMQGMADAAAAAQQRLDGMAVEIVVSEAVPYPGGYAVAGSVTNLTRRAMQVPPVTFEFLDAQGNVVATEVLDAGRLAGDAEGPLSLNATGDDIVGWRYTVGS